MSEQTQDQTRHGKLHHLRWFMEGVHSWNSRRRRSDFEPDLRGFDISSVLRQRDGLGDLEYADLRGVDMNGAWLQGTSFKRCALDQADFRSADLTGGDLIYASLIGADFDGAVLKGTKMGFSKCVNARFSYGTLGDAQLFEPPIPLHVPASEEIPRVVSDLPQLLLELKCLHNRLMLRLNYHKTPGPRMFYRGHGVHSWTLTPSLLRPTSNVARANQDAESQMFTEFIASNPDEFAGERSLLSQLIKAREYGLPTRVLDITSDPLVALFFAVEDENLDLKDGAVHAFAVPPGMMRQFNSDSVAIVCAFARLRDRDQRMLIGNDGSNPWLDQYIDTATGGSEFRWSEIMDRIAGEITKENRGFTKRIDPIDLFRVFVVAPLVDERRLRKQSGAFLLSAFHETFDHESIMERMPDTPLYDHYTFRIKAGAKPEIREELARLNLTRETLLGGLEVSAKEIRKRYGYP